jgi:serine/threonine-protein kinase
MNDETIIKPRRPNQVGKYRIDAVLGEGAMGIVYAGHDPDIDRQVAIKTVHQHLINETGGDWLVRFAREARAGGRVLHQNLVTIFDYLEQDNIPYLVMERVRSTTLEDRLETSSRLELREVHGILAQILDGLSCIHKAGIVHRDLKPANVMITENGTVKLTDFGIARITAMDKTGAGMVGTPSYMAPEQFAGGDVDARADIYATGVLLYELLTGEKPYKGGGIEALLIASRTGKFAVPSDVVSGLSAALDRVALTAMSIDPNDRFVDASDMRDALIEAMPAADNTGLINLTAATRPSRPNAKSHTMLSRMSTQTMTLVERNLVAKIGPIGQVIARRAAASAQNPGELLDLVLRELTQADERQEVRNSILRLLSENVGPAPDGIPESTLQHLTDLLKPYLGPISSVLVKRAATKVVGMTELINELAENITDPIEKTRFIDAAQIIGDAGDTHA